MSSSVYIDNNRTDVLILELDDTMLTAEAQYSINFSISNKEISFNPVL